MRTSRATSCMCDASRAFRSGGSPAKAGIEVAIDEEVDEDLARDPVDFLLRHSERLGDVVALPAAAS